MSLIVTQDNYLDVDVAYLLGLIIARGFFHIEGDIRRLIIDFPFKLEQLDIPKMRKGKIDRESALRLSLDEIRARINQLLEVNVEIEAKKHLVQLKAIFTKNTMSLRNITHLLKGKTDYREFSVPEVLYQAPIDMQKEFIRGIADAASNPSPKDALFEQRNRIVLEFQHENWKLPIQVCRLLQENLGIKVSHILWGHPNIRGGKGWAKEHRMRIFAEDFIEIGYNFRFKQDIFEYLLKENKKLSLPETKICNPKIKKPRRRKKKHRDEKSRSLPKIVRKHFDSYFEVCKAIGCQQGEPSPQGDFFEEDD